MPVEFRTMLPPMHSTMAELLAWAGEVGCQDMHKSIFEQEARGAGPSPLGDAAVLVWAVEASLPRHEA